MEIHGKTTTPLCLHRNYSLDGLDAYEPTSNNLLRRATSSNLQLNMDKELQELISKTAVNEEKTRVIRELRKLIVSEKLPAGTWGIIKHIFD